MVKEIPKNYSYLKKDLIKLLILSGVLLVIIISLSILDKKTNYISKLAEKIIGLLIR